MTLDPMLTRAIDAARARGANPERVLRHLRDAGVPDPEDTIAEYMAQPLPDGRRRAEVNPGDPAEWGDGQ